MAESTKARGVWTPANVVTLARVALVPLWLAVAQLSVAGTPLAWASFVGYAIISLTDKLDGYLARSRGEVTDFGKFLDPIADKLAVVAAMLFLLSRGMLSVWAVVIVVAREFLVSGLRMVVASEGTVVAASGLGKAKTAATMVSLCLYLLSLCLPFTGWIRVAADVLLLVAIALTAWSGVDYFVKCWPSLAG